MDVETARKLLDGPTVVLDIRPEREYEGRSWCPASLWPVILYLPALMAHHCDCVILLRYLRTVQPRSHADAEGRITKPARRTVSVPYAAGGDAGAFVAQVAAKFPSRAAKLIVVRASGCEFLQQQAEAGGKHELFPAVSSQPGT